jgi:outer membrane PBP1 activator LpoA protein
MSYNSLKYISEARRARANRVREDGWEDAMELISRRRFGAAYRRMVNACARAWQIECKQET